MSKLYFLTVNYNSTSLIKRLVKSINFGCGNDYQIVIINNSAEDKNIFDLNSEQTTIIEAKENLGFGRACNLGLRWIIDHDKSAVVWLINPDAYFKVDAANPLSTAIDFFKQHLSISILGTIVVDSEGNLTSAGGTFTPGTAALSIADSWSKDFQDYLLTDWVSGCSLLIDLAKFEQVPQFDPRYFMYYEDLDFCLRYSQQGHQIAVTNQLKVFHDTSSISDRNMFIKYQHITKSYLIHIEKHGNLPTFILTNIRMTLNTLRLIILKPQQGLGKLIGYINYWRTR